MNLGEIPYIGEWMAIINAMLWAIAFILFKISGHTIAPFSLNLFKNTLGSICLALTLVLFRSIIPTSAPLADILWLVGSGILGIAIADTLMFKALNILGASRSALVDCLYSPFIIFFSFLFLRESITWPKLVGMLLMILSIPLVYSDRKKNPISNDAFLKGLLWGTLAMASMAIGIVYIKPILERYPVLWTTSVRMIGGTIAMFVFAVFQKNSKAIFSIFKPQAAWKFALPSSFLGAFPCILLWVGSFTYADASIAGLITQLSVFFTVILAGIFLQEKLTLNKWLAVAIAFLGSAIATFHEHLL